MLRFDSRAIAEHSEVPLADDGRLEQLIEHFHARGAEGDQNQPRACYVASVGDERDPQVRAAQLAEIVALVTIQGGSIVGQEICHLSEPNARTLLGRGLALGLAERARRAGASMLVLDAELSPSQTRNLEDVAGIAVCDREAVILNVFLCQAKTRRARIQAEIAQLEYLRPRIRGVGLDMDQQTGGNKHARGPGETASELLARKLDDRLAELRKASRKLEVSSKTQRQGRNQCKRLVLVGYTNAGKTSLMNALTASALSARDRPFETLDTTSRCLTRHGGEVVLSDTVGVIRRLPARLLASFESTLSEITEASLVVVVVDASDYERDLQLQTTLELVEKLGAGDVPRFYVFNKIDRLDSPVTVDELARYCGSSPWAALSSRDPEAVATLAQRLIDTARSEEETESVQVPYGRSQVLQLIYSNCRVLRSDATDEGLELRIQGPARVMSRILNDLKKNR